MPLDGPVPELELVLAFRSRFCRHDRTIFCEVHHYRHVASEMYMMLVDVTAHHHTYTL